MDLVEIWVLQSSGTCLFHYTKEEKVDPYLFAGFFTAINQLGQHYSKSAIDGIIMRNYLLMSHYDEEYKLTFVGRSKNTKHRKKLQKILNNIRDKFTETFTKDEVDSWNGNLVFFQKFDDNMHLYFHDDQDLTDSLRSIF